MGRLVRRHLTGMQTVAEWAPGDAAALEAARAAFAREVDAGYTAVRSDERGNEPVTELPADADLVILTMPMGGGEPSTTARRAPSAAPWR
jgi:hypothetical protein